MQKIILLFAFTALNVYNLCAQTYDKFYQKGEFSLSTTFPAIGFEKDIYTAGLNIRPGFNIYDKLNLGAEFGVSQSKLPFSTSYYVEPSLKYYPLSRKITPVLKLGYRFGTFNDSFNKTFQKMPTLGLGVSIMNPKCKFNFEAGFNYRFTDAFLFENLTPYISFGIFLGRKKK